MVVWETLGHREESWAPTAGTSRVRRHCRHRLSSCIAIDLLRLLRGWDRFDAPHSPGMVTTFRCRMPFVLYPRPRWPGRLNLRRVIHTTMSAASREALHHGVWATCGPIMQTFHVGRKMLRFRQRPRVPGLFLWLRCLLYYNLR